MGFYGTEWGEGENQVKKFQYQIQNRDGSRKDAIGYRITRYCAARRVVDRNFFCLDHIPSGLRIIFVRNLKNAGTIARLIERLPRVHTPTPLRRLSRVKQKHLWERILMRNGWK